MFFYKAMSINDLANDVCAQDLFVSDDCYYLQSNVEIDGMEQISEKEFQSKSQKIVYIGAAHTEPQLTETEQAILDTAINVDYLVCMKELEI